jgi:hypothetical protein
MGVAFCLLFMWWFISGIFMMYWSYPEVSEQDRLARAPKLDAARVKLSPAEAAMAAGIEPNGVRLASFDGRPAYFIRAGRGSAIVYADTGEQQDIFSPELNLRTAAAWAAQPGESAKVETVSEPDQWTLGVRRQLPLQKYTFPDGQQVYLSEETGDVVQYTTLATRIYSHLGAIPHWLYYTPLRVNGQLWTNVVVWSSGIATIAALLGLIVGLDAFPFAEVSPSGPAYGDPVYGPETATYHSRPVLRHPRDDMGVQRNALDGPVPDRQRRTRRRWRQGQRKR